MNLPLVFQHLQLGTARSKHNRFISVHALGFVFYNMLHCINWVINGLPERFPKLRSSGWDRAWPGSHS